MRTELLAAARQIRGTIRTSEDGYDVALANNARLVATLLEARVNAGLPAKTGREALETALEAITLGAKARERLIETHEQLARLNVRELAIGDMAECPAEWGFAGLTVVGSASDRKAA